MGDISFAVDFKALLGFLAAAALFFILLKRSRQYASPQVFFSAIRALKSGEGRARWGKIPHSLMWAAMVAFACAFVDPHVFINRQINEGMNPQAHKPTEGIAIYLVLDQSGSMSEPAAGGRHSRMSKIDLLRQVSREFIAGDPKEGLAGRPNDMIGLIAFARGARVLSPLTLDHAAVLQALSQFNRVGDKDQDGTSIGYAIFKTANMIAATRHYAQELIEKGEPAYTIKNSVMILITDGLQDPNPLDKGKRLRNIDVPEAAAYAKEQGIRLYIINVEPKLSTEEFTPYRNIMQRAAELTGGKFYMVDNTANLEEIYRGIDQLEKSALPAELQGNIKKADRPDLYRRISFYPYLIALGLLLLLTALTLEMTWLRRIP